MKTPHTRTHVAPAINPMTRRIEHDALWIDGYFGKRRFGVQFPSDGTVYRAEAIMADWQHSPANESHTEGWFHPALGTVARRSDGGWQAYGRSSFHVFATPEEGMRWLEGQQGKVTKKKGDAITPPLTNEDS